jgi:hypothetical protein
VLAGDAHLPALPPLAERVQVGQDDVAECSLERERREDPVEGRLRAGLVEAIERAGELGREPRDPATATDASPGPAVPASARRAASAAEKPASRCRCIERTRSSSAAE